MPDTSSRRQLILAEIRRRLSGIHTADGYQTDAGLTVAEQPLQLGPDDAEAIVIAPASSVFTQPGYRTMWPVEIQVLSRQPDSTKPSQEEAVVADVLRAMETADRTLGGLLVDVMRRLEIRVVPPEPGVTTGGVVIPYELPCVIPWGG